MISNLQGFEEVLPTLVKVASELEDLKKKRDDELKKNHDRFNLFTVLLRSDDEVRLHTRYLTHLLNPKGSHDCEWDFLHLFLEVVGLSEKLDSKKCRAVYKEFYIGKGKAEKGNKRKGYIDILIEFDDAMLVIENKIWAADQDRQLERYVAFAEEKHKKNVFCLYLTPRGKRPDKMSSRELKEELNLEELNNKTYGIISYRDHMLKWLELCIENTGNFAGINQSLMQYKKTIREDVLKMKTNQEDIDAVMGNFEQDSVISRNTSVLIAALNSLRNKQVISFFDQLIKKLGSVDDCPFNSIEQIWKGWKGDDGERSYKNLALSLNNRVFIAMCLKDSREFYVGITDDLYNESVGGEFTEKIERENSEITKCDWPKLKCKLFDVDEDLNILKGDDVIDRVVKQIVLFDEKIKSEANAAGLQC